MFMPVVFTEATKKEKEKENSCDYVNRKANMKAMCFEAEMTN